MRRAGALLILAGLALAAVFIAALPKGSSGPVPSADPPGSPVGPPAREPASTRKAMWGPIVPEGGSQFPSTPSWESTPSTTP